MECLDLVLKYVPSWTAIIAAIAVYHTRKYFLLKERIIDLSKIAVAQSDVVEVFQGYHYSIGKLNLDTTVSIEPIVEKMVHLRGVIRQSFTIDKLARDRLLEVTEIMGHLILMYTGSFHYNKLKKTETKEIYQKALLDKYIKCDREIYNSLEALKEDSGANKKFEQIILNIKNMTSTEESEFNS